MPHYHLLTKLNALFRGAEASYAVPYIRQCEKRLQPPSPYATISIAMQIMEPIQEFDEELFAETMREEGEDRLNQLYLTLMKEQKSKDLERAMRNKNFRNTLYERYGL